jgi:hypothetical protein
LSANGYRGPTNAVSNRHGSAFLGGAFLALLVGATGTSFAAPQEPNAGAAQPGQAGPDDPEDPKPRVFDPGVLPGRPMVYAARPTFSPEVRVCSARTPVCVHARMDAKDVGHGSAALATLGAFERAWDTLTGALALPAPDVDPTTLSYDVFLVDRADMKDGSARDLTSTRLEARDVRSRVDRARTFTLVDQRVRDGCILDATAAEAIARASLYRVAPATEEGTARAQSRALAELAVPCAVAFSADAVAAFQSRPGKTFCDAHAGDEGPPAATLVPVAGGTSVPASPPSVLFAEGASTFWTRLDWAFGRTPGGIITASWALHPTMTPLEAARWSNEPDTFDVLRLTFKGALSTRSTVHDLWLDFAVARAFGGADDGVHLPELQTLGEAARVPFDWDIAWPTKARRLAARSPTSPTGASYVMIRHAGARPGARLRAEIEWEEHALFRWAFVKIDANGRELGRVVIPTTERATQAQMTLVDLDNVDRVLLVGVNVGDPAYAFDPDDEVWEPHGWLVTIAEE